MLGGVDKVIKVKPLLPCPGCGMLGYARQDGSRDCSCGMQLGVDLDLVTSANTNKVTQLPEKTLPIRRRRLFNST